MRYRELKVGMLITGKPNNGYSITNDKSICKVLELRGINNSIYVEVLFSPNKKHIGSEWRVDYVHFVKYNGIFGEDMGKDDYPFQVGDYIIGNEKNNYSFTKRGQICKVVNVYDKAIIGVCVVDMNTYRESHGCFNVKTQYFNLYKKAYHGLFSKLNIRGLIKVADNKPVLPVGVSADSPCYKQIVKEFIDNGLIEKEG